MKFNSLLSIAFIIIIASACNTSKIYTAHVKSEEIKDLNYVTPISMVGFVGQINRPVSFDSLNNRSNQLILSSLLMNEARLRLAKHVAIEEQSDKIKISAEIESLIHRYERTKRLNVPIPATIKSLLDDQEGRFLLVTVAHGFIRSDDNYLDELVSGVARGIATAYLTGIAVTHIPKKSHSTIHAFIFDKENNRVIFYRKGFLDDNSPLNQATIDKQIYNIFRKYLIGTSSDQTTVAKKNNVVKKNTDTDSLYK